ncbi:hypothetical protein [Pyxidicoccus trucidator]|uniref:hypothetical protein n=1 Tax=Pyxidicoccus trucidator TaxID=2709662 RepID=UPI0013DBE3D6|nr:hypothetical protein [Pyxidicoccus trucidator]
MTPEFIQRTLTVLRELERQPSTSEQFDALQASRTLLHFILGRGDSGEFTKFVENFGTAPLTPLFSFSTREEADDWLRNHPAPPHGAIIRAANDFYSVADVRELNHRKLLRLPPPEEYGALDAAEDEDEPVPPKPRPGERFSFFELYSRTCHHLHELEKRTSSPEQLEALRTAKISFDFVIHIGEERGFEDYVESIRSARTAPPLRAFASQEDAGAWLMTQPEPPPPAVVAIGNELYAVGYNRRRGQRVLTRIPTQQELAAGTP